MSDKRFTITSEETGAPKIQWVVRFCGDFISAHDTRALARAGKAEAITAWQARIDDLCNSIYPIH